MTHAIRMVCGVLFLIMVVLFAPTASATMLMGVRVQLIKATPTSIVSQQRSALFATADVSLLVEACIIFQDEGMAAAFVAARVNTSTTKRLNSELTEHQATAMRAAASGAIPKIISSGVTSQGDDASTSAGLTTMYLQQHATGVLPHACAQATTKNADTTVVPSSLWFSVHQTYAMTLRDVELRTSPKDIRRSSGDFSIFPRDDNAATIAECEGFDGNFTLTLRVSNCHEKCGGNGTVSRLSMSDDGVAASFLSDGDEAAWWKLAPQQHQRSNATPARRWNDFTQQFEPLFMLNLRITENILPSLDDRTTRWKLALRRHGSGSGAVGVAIVAGRSGGAGGARGYRYELLFVVLPWLFVVLAVVCCGSQRCLVCCGGGGGASGSSTTCCTVLLVALFVLFLSYNTVTERNGGGERREAYESNKKSSNTITSVDFIFALCAWAIVQIVAWLSCSASCLCSEQQQQQPLVGPEGDANECGYDNDASSCCRCSSRSAVIAALIAIEHAVLCVLVVTQPLDTLPLASTHFVLFLAVSLLAVLVLGKVMLFFVIYSVAIVVSRSVRDVCSRRSTGKQRRCTKRRQVVKGTSSPSRRANHAHFAHYSPRESGLRYSDTELTNCRSPSSATRLPTFLEREKHIQQQLKQQQLQGGEQSAPVSLFPAMTPIIK